MRRAMFLILALFFLLIATPSTASASFNVEIQNVDRKMVADVIAADLTGLGYSILTVNDYQIAFRRDVEDMMAQVFLGSRFNPVPEVRAYFNVVAVGQNVRISLDVRVVSNPDSAFEQYAPVTDKSWPLYLEVLRRRFNGYIGYGFSCFPSKKSGCFEVAEVLPKSSAEEQGMKPGDLVVQINGRSASKMTQKDLESSVAGLEGSMIALVLKTNLGETTATLVKTFIPGEFQTKRQAQPSVPMVETELSDSIDTEGGVSEQVEQPSE